MCKWRGIFKKTNTLVLWNKKRKQRRIWIVQRYLNHFRTNFSWIECKLSITSVRNFKGKIEFTWKFICFTPIQRSPRIRAQYILAFYQRYYIEKTRRINERWKAQSFCKTQYWQYAHFTCFYRFLISIFRF